jgi:putative endonuclease
VPATDDVGQLAENLVAQWLVSHGWRILQQRWRCRWGELDLVMQTPNAIAPSQNSQPSLVFVEVKARSKGNWDSNGLLSITPQKRQKLWQTAELFLATFPELSHYPCRFDVALVSHRPSPQPTNKAATPTIQLNHPVYMNGHSLTLHRYIQNAFVEEGW